MAWVATAIGGSAVLGYMASSNATDASNNATNASVGAANQQTQLARDQFDWNKQNYETNILPQQQKSQAIQDQIAQQSLDSSKQQQQFSTDQQQYYKDTFQPVEKKTVDDANNYDSQANVDKQSGMASANVNQQFSNARNQSARLAGRYGMSSTAFSGPAGSSERAQALGAAGAATGAATATQDKAIALRAGVANFGRNMPNTSAQFGQISNQSGAVGTNAAGAALGSSTVGGSVMNNATGNYINTIGSAANLTSNAYNNQANMYSNQAAGFGMLAGGIMGNKTAQSAITGMGNSISNFFTPTPTPIMDAGISGMPTYA
ncbi:hypothetical protein [Polynucleobacter sp. UK-Kesae-W10]|uniref:hypothetical protein n=1 Tax=Polynucleobacter sp. UK-Kesae-W10 TaxID=1819738 RepID=UPI001C0C3BDC|nr:hypothetical protein [Polynucleobacter sp. UK-Kesae-W10]MBU3577603.1 hypothetical protein [Polynucleobacter sp. UK-Kesae-W10]